MAVIMDLRDELAKLQRTVEAQDALPEGGGITNDFVARFRAMLKRAYPVRGRNESAESWAQRLWEFCMRTYLVTDEADRIEGRAWDGHKAAEDEFEATIGGGGVLRRTL